MGALLSFPVWLASNLYPMWVSYRLLEGYRAWRQRSDAGAKYQENGEEIRRAKDEMLKFWVMHAALRIVGSIVSPGTFAGVCSVVSRCVVHVCVASLIMQV